MNARQARQRRHQWYYSPCAPFEKSSAPDQAKDSTNNLNQNPTINSAPPNPPEPPPALAAPNERAPEAPPAAEAATPAQAATQAPTPLTPTTAPSAPDSTNPTRCLFSFSDGRHCRLPRAKTDPRFCPHHTATNVKAKKARKRSRANQAIVELQTPSGKLTTATDLNYALSQVFRSLAQDRIRPRNAAALGYLGQLLLQTLPGVKSEFSDTFGYRAWDESVKAMLNRPSDPRQLPHNEHLTIRSGSSSRATNRSEESLLIQQNEHLRGIPPHPSQNEHLRKP